MRSIEIRLTEKRFFHHLGTVSPLIQPSNHIAGNDNHLALWKNFTSSIFQANLGCCEISGLNQSGLNQAEPQDAADILAQRQ